ncbi:MAG: diaminopimelate decarboxylase, partial [Oligoflexales bacterium]|nr:diaminopimelate decarboxylase [Oligoflexales bacterium]
MRLFGTMEIRDNSLFIGGVSALELARSYGTPLYVMDESLIREKCRKYVEAFRAKHSGNRVVYAGKAFLTSGIVKIIHEEGLYLDVVSGGELYTAYKSGFPMGKIYFHGNNKTGEEIRMGITLNVGRFVVDNFHELDRISEIASRDGARQKILLRVSPGIEAHTHDYIKTGQIDSKFGFPMVHDRAIEAAKRAVSLPGVELVGLHCHIGSQIFDTVPYEDAVGVMLSFMLDVQTKTG